MGRTAPVGQRKVSAEGPKQLDWIRSEIRKGAKSAAKDPKLKMNRLRARGFPDCLDGRR